VSVSKAQARILTAVYGSLRRSGFLKSRPGRTVFVQAYFLYKRLLEDPFAALAKNHPELFRNGDVLDIGANIGYTARVFASAIDRGRRVYAFEPESSNFELLQTLATRAGLAIVPVQAALGAADGKIQIVKNPDHPADHHVLANPFEGSGVNAELETVTLRSVDSFMHGRPDPICFIKIDVQGYEPAVCAGMWETLERWPEAAVALEYMPSAMRELGLEFGPTLAAFSERGYTPFEIGRRGEITPGLPRLKDGGYADILFLPASVASRKFRV
jgi:FkbM family methyltransferase